MTPNWTPLDDELTLWAEAGLRLPLWWRDDDAIAPTPALSRLDKMAANLGMPVHLAVIPARAEGGLADALTPRLVPVVHGWTHDNHAPGGEKKAEFGRHRPLVPMRAEAEAGLGRMTGLFGTDLVPMFVPPWNRIDPALLPSLAALGYRWLSTFTPRATAEAAPGLTCINTHFDPIDWKGHRGLADPDKLIAQVARQLGDRRRGLADSAEPYGILTHHLVHDAAIWAFCDRLLTRLLSGPAFVMPSLKGPTS
ncbi:polysaccharide deacetylase family protein [Sedimentitalea sp. JM2-8]|uniref:Polysaccharide deacetylase family protein n=1 Tax=Sedimentitalea xiamensis TaxID=3050037 RepID=A0ABT7FIL7_9RHOB|nr:polysaccharide deacetylase family protein [Sedimentitalea xiamensis]MDK3074778.1 polysaccharide deacetylase family protein [Sedimentitalea xiamensis]